MDTVSRELEHYNDMKCIYMFFENLWKVIELRVILDHPSSYKDFLTYFKILIFMN